MATVVQNSLSESLAVDFAMAAKKIKLDEPAISEILVADTDSESGDEVSDLEDEFSESEKNKKHQHKKTSPKLQQVAEDHQPGDRLKEGT